MSESKSLPNPRRIYWDSCLYIDFLTGDKPYQQDLVHMIASWERKEVVLVTSALTIAEVLYIKCEGILRTEDSSRRPDIEALFEPPANHEPLVVVELTRAIALKARDLRWEHGIEPKDCVHVASALEAHCETLYTHDGGLLSKHRQVGGDPVLKIELPTWEAQTEFQLP